MGGLEGGNAGVSDAGCYSDYGDTEVTRAAVAWVWSISGGDRADWAQPTNDR